MADPIDPIAPADPAAAPVLEGPEATQAFLEGAHEVIPDADGRVRVVRNGQVGSVAGDKLEGFLRSTPGARLATQGELQEQRRSREYGEGVGTELRTAAEAAASTLTMGGTDYLAGELGGDATREGLRERRERNPLSRGLGTGIGIGLTALATGGSGGLAKALSATPAGLALKAGQAAEGALLTGRLAATAEQVGAAAQAAGAVRKATALAAGGALENSIFGAGEAISDWSLNPDAKERTAEHLMASIGERAGKGALLGGIAAGGLSLTGSALGRGSKVALERIKRALGKGSADAGGAAAGQAGRELRIGQNIDASVTREGKQTLDTALDASATARSVDGTTVELELGGGKPLKGGPLQELADGATARKRFAERQQLATTEVSDDVTKLNTISEELVGRTAATEEKEAAWARLMSEDPPANMDVTNQETLAHLEALDDELATASTQSNLYEKRGMAAFKAVTEDIGEISAGMRMARTPEELATNMRGLDRLKTRLGRVRNSLESGAAPDAAAAAVLNKHYEALRQMLESTDNWGRGAAAMQKENNAAISSYLDYARSFDARFALERTHRTTKGIRDQFARVAEADPAKVGPALNGLGTSESAKVEDVLITGSQRQAQMLETLGKNLGWGPERMAKVREARAAANRIGNHATGLKSLARKGDRWDETIENLQNIPWVGGGLAKLKVSTGRALSLGLDAKAAAQAASTSAERLSVTGAAHAETAALDGAAQRLSAMQRVYMASQGVATKISQATERYARTIGSTAGRAARLTATAGTGDPRADRKERFDKAYASVREFERDPEAALGRVFRVQGSLGTIAPMLANTYADKTLRAATFLSEKMPGHEAEAHLFADHDDVKPPPHVSDDEKREFLKYVDAVEHPLSLIDELEAGRVKPQTVEAVQAVYPKLYADIRDGILEQLDAAEVTPPYRARLSLGILFDLPTDSALEPEFLQMLQASGANAAASPQEAQNQATLSPSQRSAPEQAGQVESRSAALQNGL
jgi:hypothetical protein